MSQLLYNLRKSPFLLLLRQHYTSAGIKKLESNGIGSTSQVFHKALLFVSEKIIFLLLNTTLNKASFSLKLRVLRLAIQEVYLPQSKYLLLKDQTILTYGSFIQILEKSLTSAYTYTAKGYFFP